MPDEAAKPGPEPLDEAARRLPNWREGVPIRLCNGQEWHFPTPRLRFAPTFDETGRGRFGRTRAALAPELDAIIDRIVEDDPTGDILDASLELAAYCLRANYRVEVAELGRLLYFEPADPENLAMWRSITDFARGSFAGPKAIPVGSDSASAPTESTPTG